MRNLVLLAAFVSALISLRAADPTSPVHWSAAKTKELTAQAKSRINKDTGVGISNLIDSAFLAYREKTSQAESHDKQADFLIINEGSGSILVGGKMVNGQLTRPGELRGDSIEGGTRYPVKAGDTLYVPKAMPHQFQVTPGQYIVYTVVKITPVE